MAFTCFCSVTVDTDYIQNEKGHYEIAVKNTITTPSGEELWVSDLTVLVINRKAKRGDGGKPSEQVGIFADVRFATVVS